MYKTLISIIIAGILIFSSCCEKKDSRIRIAISKEKSEKSTTKYANWLINQDSTIECLYMYPLGIDSALKLLETCDGLLVTGGEDVFPGNYGKLDDTARCGTFNLYRDSLEFALIDAALENDIPVFGVCRGEQILNIHLGGTLYIDIPTDFDSTVAHRFPGFKRAIHPVQLVDSTLLFEICGHPDDKNVLSNHHQGIEQLGEGLVISAWSADGLPEAIEWESNTGHPFLIAVQWHPEAMEYNHMLSNHLAQKFLEACEHQRSSGN